MREREGEKDKEKFRKESFHLLIHSPNDPKKQDWTRQIGNGTAGT